MNEKMRTLLHMGEIWKEENVREGDKFFLEKKTGNIISNIARKGNEDE